MIDLKNKNIIITGASSGIGMSIAKLSSKLGARLILIGRSEDKLNSLKDELSNRNHITISCDITDYDNIEIKLKKSLNDFGKVDGFVHSAGIEMTRPLKLLKPKFLDEVLKVNLISGINLTRILTNRGVFNEFGGSIVYISSVAGIAGQSGKSGYSASKAGIIAAGKSLALEFASKKIRVNSIIPAMVETEMSKKILSSLNEEGRKKIEDSHPLGIGKPDDVAHSVIFLLSDKSRWITGSSIVVDGGFSV